MYYGKIEKIYSKFTKKQLIAELLSMHIMLREARSQDVSRSVDGYKRFIRVKYNRNGTVDIGGN
jgi:hypothetical protein